MDAQFDDDLFNGSTPEARKRREAAMAALDAEMQQQELSYRRGYYHGYSTAMDDLRPACKPSRWQAVAHFFDGALTKWRYDDPVPLEMPPNCPSSKAAVTA